ncbi:hypothetical protein YC2023_087206 [Brassica napus]
MMHQRIGGEDTSVLLHLILGKSSSYSPSCCVICGTSKSYQYDCDAFNCYTTRRVTVNGPGRKKAP